MINRLSVRTKMLLILIVPLILFAAACIYLLNQNASGTERLNRTLYETAYQGSSLVLNADRDMYQSLTAFQSLQQLTGSDRDAGLKDFHDNAAQVDDRLGQAAAIIQDQGLQNTITLEDGRPVTDILTQALNDFHQWASAAEEAIAANRFSSDNNATLLAQFTKARENLNQFTDIIDGYAQKQVAAARSESSQTRTHVTLFLIVEWAVLLLLGFLIIRQMNRSVRSALSRIRLVTEGDLRLPSDRQYPQDELGSILQAIDAMTGKMRALIGQITTETQSVSHASGHLSSAASHSAETSKHVAEQIHEVSAAVGMQSTIAEETSKAVAEMTIGVQRIAESVGMISDHSGETNQQSELGNEQLLELMDQMKLIAQSSEQLSGSIVILTEKSDQIGSITEKITGIANQTNILALNAGIEAARAGEHGRGFAVVAAEIRKLAAISLQSAESISGLIDDTRGEIRLTSQQMAETVRFTEQGKAVMTDVVQRFESIVESIRQVATQTQESSAVTEQLSASSEEILAGMEQASASAVDIAGKAQTVASATERQLAVAADIASASERLQGIVNELNRAVGSFKL